MNWFSALAVYFVIWWVVLFAVLPFAVRTQDEADNVAPGTVSSAPVRPLLAKKFLATTIVAAVIFIILWGIYVTGVIDLESFWP